MSTDTDRFAALEKEVHAIKGALDWAKVAFALLGTFTVAGFALLTTLSIGVSSKVDGVSRSILEEFRAMRLETAAQTSAIANAVTAAKQVPPQVLLVPAPIHPAQPDKP